MSNLDKMYESLKIFARPRAQSENSNIQKTEPGELVINTEGAEQRYSFDHVFDANCSQETVYDTIAQPIVNKALEGFNGTVLAYGPSGTGKSYTMFGDVDSTNTLKDSLGIIPRVTSQLLLKVAKLDPVYVNSTLKILFIEIHNEEVFDLLNQRFPLRVFDDPTNKHAVILKGVQEYNIFEEEQALKLINQGIKERKSANSHTIFSISLSISQRDRRGFQVFTAAKLDFVDMMASDLVRGVKNWDGTQKIENVNRSLFNFLTVLKAHSSRAQNVPFRDSKLTRILQSSFGGNAAINFVATYLPGLESLEKTISCFDCAQLAKTVINVLNANIVRGEAELLKKYETEKKELLKDLAATNDSNTSERFKQDQFVALLEDNETKNAQILEYIKKIELLEKTKQENLNTIQILVEDYDQAKASLDLAQAQIDDSGEQLKNQSNHINNLKDNESTIETELYSSLNVYQLGTESEDTLREKLARQRQINKNNMDIANNIISLNTNNSAQLRAEADACKAVVKQNISEIEAHLGSTLKVAQSLKPSLEAALTSAIKLIDTGHDELNTYFNKRSQDTFNPSRGDEISEFVTSAQKLRSEPRVEISWEPMKNLAQKLDKDEKYRLRHEGNLDEIRGCNATMLQCKGKLENNKAEARKTLLDLIQAREENVKMMRSKLDSIEESAVLVRNNIEKREKYLEKVQKNFLKVIEKMSQLNQKRFDAKRCVLQKLSKDLKSQYAELQLQLKMETARVTDLNRGDLTEVQRAVADYKAKCQEAQQSFMETQKNIQLEIEGFANDHRFVTEKYKQIISTITNYSSKVNEVLGCSSVEVREISKRIKENKRIGDTPLKNKSLHYQLFK